MISLGSTNAGSSDIYTAPVPVTVTAPTGAYFAATTLYLGIISDVPLVAGDRTIHIQVKQDAAEDIIVLEGDWFISVAAGDVAKWFSITVGEFPWYLANDLIVTVSSDNSNDTDVTLSVAPFTADADYLLNRVAAVGSPLADSLAERIKAIDNKLPSASYLLGSSSNSGQINSGAFATDAIATAAVKADAVTKIQAGLSTATALAAVKAETALILTDTNAVAAWTTTTLTLPTQAPPTATPTITEALAYLYAMWRNKKTQTADTFSLYADNGQTVICAAAISDDGTTGTFGEIGTGG